MQFVEEPHQAYPRITQVINAVQERTISTEILSMLAKNAIEMTSFHPKEFVSSLFVVPKKTGDLRPVINLKPLNKFIFK
jgi:hypothetical protein